MIIDVSRRPLLILPDEVTESVVVRSVGNSVVSGLVSYKNEPYRRAAHPRTQTVDIEPGASLTRGSSTCYETRLILPGAKIPKNPYAHLEVLMQDEPPWMREQREQEKKPEVTLLPDPFEIASAYKDSLTGFAGTWRLGFRVEQHKKLWLISVLDIAHATGAALCTVAVKGLNPNPAFLEPLPLSKATRRIAGGTAWDRILGDD